VLALVVIAEHPFPDPRWDASIPARLPRHCVAHTTGDIPARDHEFSH
jgi:hypothetical protein